MLNPKCGRDSNGAEYDENPVTPSRAYDYKKEIVGMWWGSLCLFHTCTVIRLNNNQGRPIACKSRALGRTRGPIIIITRSPKSMKILGLFTGT